MNSYVWFKIHDKTFIKSTGISIVLSSIAFYLYVYMGLPIRNLIAIFPLITVSIGTMFSFNYEIFSLSENIYATPISVRKLWKMNCIYGTVLGYILGEVVLISGLLILGEHNGALTGQWIPWTLNLINMGSAAGLISLSTIHYATYSKALQWIASIFSLSFAAFPFLLPAISVRISLRPVTPVFVVILIIVMLVISNAFMLLSDQEKVIINTSKEFHAILAATDVE